MNWQEWEVRMWRALPAWARALTYERLFVPRVPREGPRPPGYPCERCMERERMERERIRNEKLDMQDFRRLVPQRKDWSKEIES